jgi:tetratricopeptide (TPR) repeat protein
VTNTGRGFQWCVWCCVTGILYVCSAAAEPKDKDIVSLLNAYERGDQDAVIAYLRHVGDIASFTHNLKASGPGWTEAHGAAQGRRRRVVAATVALEAASFRFWPEEIDPLIEWGCELLRKDTQPDESERLWERASVAIFGRARNDGRLVTRAGPGAPLGSLKRAPASRIDHIAHALQRFPDEPRFRFAQAMLLADSADTEPARDAVWTPTERLPANSAEAVRRAQALRAIQLFERLRDVPELRDEADVRIGDLFLTLRRPETALKYFTGSRNAADVFVAYLARFLAGRASDLLGERGDAEISYRSALTVMPGTESAAEALAADLFLDGKRDAAYGLAEDALAGPHDVNDPWAVFGYGDLRFIPELMSKLRAALN